MTAKSNKERAQALRDRRVAAGLVRLDIFAPPSLHAAIRQYANSLISLQKSDK